MPTGDRRRSSLASLRRASVTSIRSLKNIFSRRLSSADRQLDTDEVSYLVDQIRSKVGDAVTNGPDRGLVDIKYFDRLSQNPHMIQRVLEEKLKESSDDDVLIEQTSQTLLEILKWRKEFGINDIKPKDFPEIFYQSRLLSAIETDQNELVIWVCCRRYKPIKGMSDSIVKFLIFALDQYENKLKKPMKLVMDCSGVGFSQVDLTLAVGVIPLWLKYYPGVANQIYLTDLPWVCKAAVNVILRMLPARLRALVSCTDNKTIVGMFGRDQCPDFFGGTCTTAEDLEALCPPDAISAEDFGKKLGFNEKEVKKIIETAIANSKIK